jgi:hypothetical protein
MNMNEGVNVSDALWSQTENNKNVLAFLSSRCFCIFTMRFCFFSIACAVAEFLNFLIYTTGCTGNNVKHWAGGQAISGKRAGKERQRETHGERGEGSVSPVLCDGGSATHATVHIGA